MLAIPRAQLCFECSMVSSTRCFCLVMNFVIFLPNNSKYCQSTPELLYSDKSPARNIKYHIRVDRILAAWERSKRCVTFETFADYIIVNSFRVFFSSFYSENTICYAITTKNILGITWYDLVNSKRMIAIKPSNIKIKIWRVSYFGKTKKPNEKKYIYSDIWSDIRRSLSRLPIFEYVSKTIQIASILSLANTVVVHSFVYEI